MSTHTYTALAALIVITVVVQGLSNNKRKRLPPGPKPLPLIGNLLDYPKAKSWLIFANWKKQYGDVVYLDMLGKPIVILNSFKACKELLDRRSAKYSDRPRFVMANELMGFEYNFAIMGYSHRWRHHRRLFHLHFHESVSLGYRPIQERSTHAFLRRILEVPSGIQDHIRMLFAETILEIAYDITPTGGDDVYAKSAEQAMSLFSQGVLPGKWLVDTYPFLKHIPSWMPGAGFKRKAEEWKKAVLASRDLPAAHVQKSLADGTAKPSILAAMLASHEADPGAKDHENTASRLEESPDLAAKSSCATAFIAGADTTLSAIQAFLLAMANNSECQRTAQAELDAVIGGSRLPNFEDSKDLPYIVAITKEVLRWHVIAPLSVPHALTEDDEYNGYFLPKGSVVVANTWHLLHDPDVYPDPLTFNPGRWILDTPEGRKLNPDVPEPEVAFGYGRRACPGRHFAQNSLFIAVASVLACYVISPLDDSGKPAERIREGVTDGILTYPLPYKIAIHPRSEKAAQMVKDTANLNL